VLVRAHSARDIWEWVLPDQLLNYWTMSAIKHFFELEPVRRRMLLAATFVVASVRVALWVLPSSLIVRRVRRIPAERRGQPVSPAVPPEVVIWAIEAASRRVPSASCLTQAVSAQFLLRRNGFSSEVCVGVNRTESGSFRAHAWLMRDGKVLLGGDPTEYAVLSGFQTPSSNRSVRN
jgi:hypothetical protein